MRPTLDPLATLRRWSVPAATLVLASACIGQSVSSTRSPAPSTERPPLASSTAIVATTTDGPIRLTLRLEGPPRNDGPSWASLAIENIGDRPIRWAGGGCGDAGSIDIDLGPAFEGGRRDWPGRLGAFKTLALGSSDPRSPAIATVGYVAEARFGNQNVACAASLRIETLAAHDRLGLRAGWDGRLADEPAPTGPATVRGTFPFVGIEGLVSPDSTASTAVTATVATSVLGPEGAKPASPGLAIDAALSDAEFAAFVDAVPEARWVNPDVTLANGIWSIGLFRSGVGDERTMFGQIRVDATGRIVGRRFEP